jgi:membrane protein YqaA with SNARE-associated domain
MEYGMDAIVRYLFAIFIRLGGLGLLILGIFDSSFLFMPLGNDLLLVALVARNRSMLLPYAAMATAGSVLGCLLIDWISRKGGEEGLPKIVPARQLKYVERRVRKNAAWAIALASIMPPPFPFTPFVAAASAFQYPKKKLFGLIAIVRFARFFLVGMLAVVFGQSIIRMAKAPAVKTVILAIVALSIVGSVISVYSWIKRSRSV